MTIQVYKNVVNGLFKQNCTGTNVRRNDTGNFRRLLNPIAYRGAGSHGRYSLGEVLISKDDVKSHKRLGGCTLISPEKFADVGTSLPRRSVQELRLLNGDVVSD